MTQRRAQRVLRVRAPHRRGAAAVLAMMFLVIFGSLAAAMAIVSQGNLATADSQLKVNRSLAAAETGVRLVHDRMEQVAATIKTREGVITPSIAQSLWSEARTKLLDDFSGEFHNIEEPYIEGGALHVGPIAVGPDAPTFTATLTPHPLAGENYGSDYYQRPPYDALDDPVNASNPLDARWVRLRVTASDGTPPHDVTRSISVDVRITKRIPYAVLSKSRVMIGRNVMIDGPIGSSFMETNVPDGHPVQMESDFAGLNDELDSSLDTFANTLITNDIDNDNRINLASETETDGISDAEGYDVNNDGYIDDYDFFLAEFDSNANDEVTSLELENGADDSVSANQLLTLIDTFGYGPGDPPPSWAGADDEYPGRPGYNDGVIDEKDRYAKIRGEVHVSASLDSWLNGSADPSQNGSGAYQDYFRGPIKPDYNESAMNFEADQNNVYEFGPEDFDVSAFRDRADGDLMAQAQAQAANHDPDDPNSPQPLGQQTTESVPFQAAHPYDYYDRPVFENMTFEDVLIPQGTNALFRNCTFIGVTFIETTVENNDDDFNYAGMQESSGDPKYPERYSVVDGSDVASTKTYANNIRFESCTFEGAVVTASPQSYTHVRNKLAFNGKTRFKIDDSTHLTEEEKRLYKRSTILAPHYSVELGTFVSPYDNDQTVNLSGTIVAGVIDMRGQVTVHGTVLTTFQPESDTGPVIGETSPQFNTTLGYFGSEDGDLEAEMPETGVGVIKVRYDPNLPLPDGVLGPIQLDLNWRTYTEGGA